MRAEAELHCHHRALAQPMRLIAAQAGRWALAALVLEFGDNQFLLEPAHISQHLFVCLADVLGV